MLFMLNKNLYFFLTAAMYTRNGDHHDPRSRDFSQQLCIAGTGIMSGRAFGEVQWEFVLPRRNEAIQIPTGLLGRLFRHCMQGRLLTVRLSSDSGDIIMVTKSTSASRGERGELHRSRS